MKSVEDLDVFQLAHEITIEVYNLTKKFPDHEKYGLISQIRRASMSIPMNLMEGSHRLNRKEYRQFVGIARGSVGELKYQLMLSRDLTYLKEDTYKRLREKAESISKMLTKLAASLADTDTFELLENLYGKTEEVSKMIQSFMNYLRTWAPNSSTP